MTELTIKKEMHEAKHFTALNTTKPKIKLSLKQKIRTLRSFGFHIDNLEIGKKARNIEFSEKLEYWSKKLINDYSHYITKEQLDKVCYKYGMVIVRPRMYKGDVGPNTAERLAEVNTRNYEVFIMCPIETVDRTQAAPMDPFLIVVPREMLEENYDSYIASVIDEWGDDLTPERLKDLKKMDQKHGFERFPFWRRFSQRMGVTSAITFVVLMIANSPGTVETITAAFLLATIVMVVSSGINADDAKLGFENMEYRGWRNMGAEIVGSRLLFFQNTEYRDLSEEINGDS